MKSIRSKIMCLLLCSVLIVSLIIGALSIFMTSDIIKNNSAENMRLLCKNNADKININFTKIEESVNTLTHYAQSELPDIESLKSESSRKAYSARIQNIALSHVENIEGTASLYMTFDPSYIGTNDGFFYAKRNIGDKFEYYSLSDIAHDESQDDSDDDSWYIPTIANTATWYESYYDINFKRYVVSYVVPMYKDGVLIGVVGADIFADYVVDLVREVSIFTSGQAAILKSDGTVLYHPHFDRGVIIGEGDPGFEGVIEKITKEESTKELISYELDGEKKQLASYKLLNGMLMVCFAPESEIYQQQVRLVTINALITAIIVVVALFIAFLVSRKLTRPIKKLNEAAKHLTDGKFDFDVRTDSNDEIGELAKTFIETRKIIQKQIHSLDKEAHVDGLTGVGNKSAFLDREIEINKEIAEGKADFSIAVFDVNMLKVANDVFGHMAGDSLLMTFAKYLSSAFDSSNVYRIGGDEFVVIIPEVEDVDSRERIIDCVTGMKELSVEGYSYCKVSCACGYSRFNKITDNQLADALHRADKEMYKNKTEAKKEPYPWQESYKGIKQLQVDRYCELLQSLKKSTDDYLYLINLEAGIIRFFGGNDNSFNMVDNQEISNGIKNMLNYVHINDRSTVKDAITSVINRDTETVDINFRMIDNTTRWVSCRGSVIKDETDSHFLLIGRISLNAVKHLYNPVTALFNKTKFEADLRENIGDNFSALMLLDIDNLTDINLKHGPAYGDEMLRMLAEELELTFSLWQLYHVEKDRFVVLLDENSAHEARSIFESIKETLSSRFSVSAALVPNDSSSYVNNNIYDYAVQTLTNSKKKGIGQFGVFSKDILLKSISETELLEELEESVKQDCNGFHLVYQPQINAEDCSIISAEALLRFESKSKGPVFPNQFIPVLEQTGLINDVGIWVADNALRQCKEWRKYNPDFRISINISPKQLDKKDTASRIINLVSSYGLPGDALIIEITESSQLDENEDVFDILTEFRQAGIQIAIDDFGKGYSNLGNLKHINANILKVDRILIKDIKENGYNYNLIYNVLEFSKSNSLKVCLEGVETKEELLVLSGLNPDIFQGYLFDKPCPAYILEAKYFIKDSEEYKSRINHIEQLDKETKHTPSINVETKTILKGLNIGLWIIRMNEKTGEGELYADEIMKNLLGIDKTTSPTDCYAHWQNNLKPKYRSTLKSMVTEMINSEKVVQVEYEWAHPKYGNLIVRCSGRCSEKKNNIILLEGFHRVISDISKS